MIEEFNSLGSQ